jgi:predicted phosphodiesterase
MSIGVISDIHGNRQALETVLESIGAAGCDEIWCLGDLVGYGADPDACVELARLHASVCLAGNHDLGVVGAIPLEQFSRGAALAATWTQRTISPETLEYLQALQPQNTELPVALYHASPRDPVWEYVVSPLQAELCLDVQAAPVALIGHSHVALSFNRAPEDTATGQTRGDDETIALEGARWLINPGSVGQPRDGDPRASWLKLDLEAQTATWHRVDYDIGGAMAAIRAAHLPESLAERLQYGQ